MKLETQADAVLHFFEKLDVDMINELLDSDRTYSDLDKAVFIQKLGVAFDQFLEAGDDQLKLYSGKCDSEECDSCGCSGFSFLGNRSGNFMDLVVKIEEGRITDIYDCSDFKADTPERNFNKRVKIDRLEFPF